MHNPTSTRQQAGELTIQLSVHVQHPASSTGNVSEITPKLHACGAETRRSCDLLTISHHVPLSPRRAPPPPFLTSPPHVSPHNSPFSLDLSPFPHLSPLQVVDLRAEVSRLKGQLEDTETARAKAVTAVEAQRDAAVERQEELSEDLRRARQAAERLTVSEEDAVIAVEKDLRAKHERDVAALQDRASKAEERVRQDGVCVFLLASFGA